MRLLNAIAQGIAVKMDELLVKAFEFLHPFSLGNQCFWADDQHRAQLTTGLKLLEDESRLDGLAHAHFICDQESWTV
jgi:hypothetical protein